MRDEDFPIQTSDIVDSHKTLQIRFVVNQELNKALRRIPHSPTSSQWGEHGTKLDGNRLEQTMTSLSYHQTSHRDHEASSWGKVIQTHGRKTRKISTRKLEALTKQNTQRKATINLSITTLEWNQHDQGMSLSYSANTTFVILSLTWSSSLRWQYLDDDALMVRQVKHALIGRKLLTSTQKD